MWLMMLSKQQVNKVGFVGLHESHGERAFVGFNYAANGIKLMQIN